MEQKRQFEITLLILATYIIVSLVIEYFTVNLIINESLLHLFYKLCSLIFIIYLYKFIKYDLKQRFSTFGLILIILSTIYFLATHFFPITNNKEDKTTFEVLAFQFLVTSLPALVQIIGEIIISIQLIKNKSNESIRIPIKIVGLAYISEILLIFTITAIISLGILWPTKLFGIISLLPEIAMVNLYLKALKMNKIQLIT
jgi:hypothetical protein